jgi:hypothetical protein
MSVINRETNFKNLIQNMYKNYKYKNLYKNIPNYEDFIKYAFNVYTHNKNKITYDINYMDVSDLIDKIILILTYEYRIQNPIKEMAFIIIRYAENN